MEIKINYRINMSDHFEKWRAFLKPENLKGNLISCALYIAVFESFKDYLVDNLKGFFINGFNQQGDIVDAQYKAAVLAKNSSPIIASLMFLQEMQAVNEKDIELFHTLRKYRNMLAHKMIDFVYEAAFDKYWDNLYALMEMRIKIEKWWVWNVDIPVTGAYKATDNVKEDDIVTGSQLFNKILLDILMGNEADATYYHDGFAKAMKTKNDI